MSPKGRNSNNEYKRNRGNTTMSSKLKEVVRNRKLRYESSGRSGEGCATVCYIIDDEHVLLKSRCPMKEAMSLGLIKGSQFPETVKVPHKLVPDDILNEPHSLKRAFYLQTRYHASPCPSEWDNQDKWDDYMEDLKPSDRKLLKFLICEVYQSYYDEEIPKKVLKSDLGVRHKNQIVQAYYALREHLDNTGRCHYDIRTDCHCDNIKKHNGKLVLLDIFYIESY